MEMAEERMGNEEKETDASTNVITYGFMIRSEYLW